MQGKLPKREDVKQDLTWRLEDIYEDEGRWEDELREAVETAEKMAAYEGKLSEGGNSLLELLRLNNRL